MTDVFDRARQTMREIVATSAVAASARGSGLPGPRRDVRPVTPDEISVLERQGCRSGDWSRIRVSGGFDPRHVANSRFDGTVVLGRTGAPVTVADGLVLTSGIFDSTIVDCEIGDDVLIDRVGLLHRIVIDSGAVVRSCCEITHTPGERFANGQTLHLACSPGGRPVAAIAEMPFSMADLMHADPVGSAPLRAELAGLSDAYVSDYGFIGAHGRVSGTGRIHACWIGAGARVAHARTIERSTILSSPDHVTVVRDGAIIRDALIQHHCEISGVAIVQESLICEGSTITRQAIVMASVIGPDCVIAEGEVAKSLVGPLVGYHHRALLVAARWPEGRGNVGHGANVGSNHTGRAPDQEIRCGEGTFFGLGVNIKMPADFSMAPYLLIATAVDTLPQRIEMPFALVSVPSRRFGDLSPAINEIRPGWMLSQNAYALARNELKFSTRQTAVLEPVDPAVFRPVIMDRVADAMARLERVAGRPWYTDREIAGLGKNVMTEEARLEGIEAYRHAMRRYAFGRVFDRLRRGLPIDLRSTGDDPVWEHARTILLHCSAERDPAAIVGLYVAEERRWAEAVESSKRRDDERGPRIIPDYAASHVPAAKDEVVVHVRAALARITAGAEALLGGR